VCKNVSSVLNPGDFLEIFFIKKYFYYLKKKYTFSQKKNFFYKRKRAKFKIPPYKQYVVISSSLKESSRFLSSINKGVEFDLQSFTLFILPQVKLFLNYSYFFTKWMPMYAFKFLN